MTRFTSFAALPVAAALAITVGACNDRANTNATLTQDSTLNRDLQMANADSVQPQLQDVPQANAPAPATAAPARPRTQPEAPHQTTPARPAGPTTTPSGNTVTRGESGTEPATATVPAGTAIALTSSDRVCTNNYKPGDRFTATVAEPVMGANGAMIPAGAKAVIQVSSVKRSTRAGQPAQIGLAVQTIAWGGRSYPVDATISDVQVESVRNANKGSDAKKVIGGAVAGAILGQILGKDTKSTVIGAATGAAAGTAVAMGTADYEGCIPQGGRIAIKLNSPATVQAE